jgi:transposase-like protein
MNDIVDRIANGQAQLLGIDDICTRLGVSRTTFDRWVRNGGGKALGGKSLAEHVVTSIVGQTVMDQMENSSEGSIKFPPPDIRIGNSPKWEMQTFKRWLRDNTQPGK